MAQLGTDWLSLTHFSTFTHSYAYFSTQIFSIWELILSDAFVRAVRQLLLVNLSGGVVNKFFIIKY